jgi:hypothetical protein
MIGFGLLVVGASLFIFGFFIGIEVAGIGYSAPKRVANFPSGIAGGILFLSGIILVAVTNTKNQVSERIENNSQSGGVIKIAKFAGNESLDNVLFKEFLIANFNIRKNDILGVFIVSEYSYKTVDEALECAHWMYNQEKDNEETRLASMKPPMLCPFCGAVFVSRASSGVDNESKQKFQCTSCARDYREKSLS